MRITTSFVFRLVPALLWLAGAALIWCQLPMKGRVLARFQWPTLVQGVNPDGSLIVTRQDRIGRFAQPLGPVMLLDPKTGEVRSSMLEPREPIIKLRLDQGLLVSRGDNHVRLVSVRENRILVEHPFAPETPRVFVDLSPSAEQFLVIEGRQLSVFDCQSGRLAWTRSPVTYAKFVRGGIVRAIVRIEGDSELRPKFEDLDGQTGETLGEGPPPKLDPTLDVGVLHSPDDSLTINFAASPPGVYDTQTNELLWVLDQQWEVALPSPYSFSPFLGFSDDSEEVWMTYQTENRSLRRARWRARDGQEIEPMTVDGKPISRTYDIPFVGGQRWTAHGDFSMRPDTIFPWELPLFLRNILPRLAPNQLRDARFVVTEIADDRPVGWAPLTENTVLAAITDDALFVNHEYQILRYDLPPGWRLGWLAVWGMLPALGLAMLFNRRRTRRTSRRSWSRRGDRPELVIR